MAAHAVGLFLHFVLKLQSLIAVMNLQGEKGNTTVSKALPVCPETPLSSHRMCTAQTRAVIPAQSVEREFCKLLKHSSRLELVSEGAQTITWCLNCSQFRCQSDLDTVAEFSCQILPMTP